MHKTFYFFFAFDHLLANAGNAVNELIAQLFACSLQSFTVLIGSWNSLTMSFVVNLQSYYHNLLHPFRIDIENDLDIISEFSCSVYMKLIHEIFLLLKFLLIRWGVPHKNNSDIILSNSKTIYAKIYDLFTKLRL